MEHVGGDGAGEMGDGGTFIDVNIFACDLLWIAVAFFPVTSPLLVNILRNGSMAGGRADCRVTATD